LLEAVGDVLQVSHMIWYTTCLVPFKPSGSAPSNLIKLDVSSWFIAAKQATNLPSCPTGHHQAIPRDGDRWEPGPAASHL